MASPTSSMVSSACPERCVAWLEGFYKAPGALWRPHNSPAPFLSASRACSSLSQTCLPMACTRLLRARATGRWLISLVCAHQSVPECSSSRGKWREGSRLSRGLKKGSWRFVRCPRTPSVFPLEARPTTHLAGRVDTHPDELSRRSGCARHPLAARPPF